MEQGREPDSRLMVGQALSVPLVVGYAPQEALIVPVPVIVPVAVAAAAAAVATAGEGERAAVVAAARVGEGLPVAGLKAHELIGFEK